MDQIRAIGSVIIMTVIMELRVFNLQGHSDYQYGREIPVVRIRQPVTWWCSLKEINALAFSCFKSRREGGMSYRGEVPSLVVVARATRGSVQWS